VAADYDAVFSDGEHIGLLLGALLARKDIRPSHVMIGHHLSSWRKRALTHLGRQGIDSVIVHSTAQFRFAVRNLKFLPTRVHLVPYSVDTDFWQPAPPSEEPLIVSCGMEHRDYDCLIKAVRDLPVSVCVGAMSHWSRDGNRLRGKLVPSNMTVDSYNFAELRQLYARSRFVVVPLRPTDFQAGITTILEAMAMGRAVIVTHTEGQSETVTGPLWNAEESGWPAYGPPPEGSTGIYVPAGDAGALRGAIVHLLQRPELAAVIGANGRRFAERHANLDLYVRRLASIIDPASAEGLPQLSDAGAL
jgi:glycosyltransferase involved in cell wall biosynthesis